jgi:hypothetical protein
MVWWKSGKGCAGQDDGLMEELVKALVTAPINGVLLLAGLGFLGVWVFGRVTERLDPGPKGRIGAGALGAVLVGISLYLSTAQRTADPLVSATPSAPANSSPEAATPPSGRPASPDAPPAADASAPVVKLERGTYTILGAELDRHGVDGLALAISIRMLNESNYPTNFWNDSFRLLADGQLYAPVSELNEVVEAHATKEGSVKFAIPKNAQTVALQIDRFGVDAPGLTIALPAKR